MGAVFANAPNEPAVVAIYVMRIYFDAACKYCRDGRRATINVRQVDYIGHPRAELNVRCLCQGRASIDNCMITIEKVLFDRMVDLNTHLRKARAKRWKGKTDAEKKATAANAARAYWADMSFEERSAEMKRRAKVRAKNRKTGK